MDSLPARARPSAHALLRWTCFALCAYFAARGVRAELREPGDFAIFREASRALLAGRDPGSVERYLYLPSFALLVAPLAWLPPATALVAWQLASLAALAWIVRALPRLVERDGGRAPPWLAWAPLLVTLRLVDSNLANAQSNLLVLAAIVASAEAWLRGRSARAGAWLALAAALKILPAALALVWLVRREKRALASFAALLALAVVVAPMACLGAGGALDALAHWWHARLAPYSGSAAAVLAQHGTPPGQSLLATAFRLLADPERGVARWDPERVLLLVRAASAALVAALLATLARSARRDAPLARLRELALATCAALALAPLVHKAHMCWLLVPAALLALPPPPELRRALRAARWGLAVAGAASIGLTTPALLGRWVATRALDWNSVFWGLAGLALALASEAWAAAGREGLPSDRPGGLTDLSVIR